MNSKPIAAIFLAQPARAAELGASLSAEGVESIPAQSSDEFYRVLNHQRVDVVIIENDLRGFLNGLEILERLYNDLLRPATILLGHLSPELQERARECGIDHVMHPTENKDALTGAVKGLLATHKHSQVVISTAARKLVQQSGLIRPLPQLLVRLCNYLDHETVSMTDLARDLSVDPKVTAELLKLTNSTSLGLRRKVTKVFDAVNFLGVRRTISLVLSANVLDAQSKLLKALPDSVRSWYNSRSVLIASTASTFARSLDDVSAETAYVLGLLQDLGILVLAQTFGDRYLQLLSRVKEISQLRLDICEKEDFRLTHADVSAALLQKWQLPQSLILLVLSHHHREPNGDRSKTEQRFLHVMQVGEAFANLADQCTPQRHQILNQLLARYGAERADQCKGCLAEAVAKTAESSELFSIPVPAEVVLNQALQKITTAAPQSEPEKEAPGRVLVIDDDPVTVDLIRQMLQTAGLEVLCCGSLQEARRSALDVSAIFCDVHLGAEKGIHLVRQLREYGCRTPVIMISGDRTRGTVVECIGAGISDYVIKPFNQAILLEKLRRHTDLALEPPTAVH